MKTYIVFISILVVTLQLIAFQQEYRKYSLLTDFVKEVSEECALREALLIDEESLRGGDFRFLKRGDDADICLQEFLSRLNLEGKGALTLTFDDQNKHVTALVTVDASKLFRLPYFKGKEIIKESCYEVVLET
ncbi:MAG: hypothetical protein WCY49_00325 [Anaerovoracaceae bacterium]|nr:hypothetical protein [Clostridiales bacterium]